VGEDHRAEARNVLIFSDRGRIIDDDLLMALRPAPLLLVAVDG
jgi:hypothetical protein